MLKFIVYISFYFIFFSRKISLNVLSFLELDSKLFSFIGKSEYLNFLSNLDFDVLMSSWFIVEMLGLSRIGTLINVEDYLSSSTCWELISTFNIGMLIPALFWVVSICLFSLRSSIEICLGIALSPILFWYTSRPSSWIVLWAYRY